MKKTFLNLRKMGFVLVAATGMLAFSCGGEEAHDEATDAIENLGEELENALNDAVEEADDAIDASCDGADSCDGGDTTDADGMACEAGACDGADASCDGAEGEEHSCDHGE